MTSTLHPTADTAEAPHLTTVRERIEPVLAALRRDSASRELRREHPYREIRALAEAGIGAYRVPRADGGYGATVRKLIELVIDIAEADSNVAQALRPVFLVADSVARGPREDPRRAATVTRILRGDLFSGTRNERAGGPGAIATTIETEGETLVITGEKFYSTGGLHADWFSGTAVDAHGQVVEFTVPTDRAGVERLDDFDAVGQRLTASGTTRLHRVQVDRAEVTGSSLRVEHPGSSLAHLILAATEAGIAAAARRDAIDAVARVARPIKHSSAESSADDPYVRLTVGKIATASFTARAVVVAAAEALDAHWREPSEHSAIAATVAVAQAYVGAAEQAIHAGELLFDVGGGRLVQRELNLDRHWRNARTVANHNPRDWKQSAVGGWLLSGEAPPANGLF